MFHYVSSLVSRFVGKMSTTLQPPSPSSAYGPYAILKVYPNDSNSFSTSEFLWRGIREVDKECFIEKMTLLKVTNGKQHELVAVSIIVPSKTPRRHPHLNITIFFERRIRKDLEQGDANEENRRGRRRSSGGDSSSYASAVLPLPMLTSSGSSLDIQENRATDIVIIPSGDERRSLSWERAFEVAFKYAPHPEDIDVVYTVTFPENARPNVLDLAVLLNQVSESYRDYHVFRTQCYYYAALVCETMRVLFQGEKTLGDNVEQSTSESAAQEMDSSRIHVQPDTDAEPARGIGRNRRRASGSRDVAGTYRRLPLVNYDSSRFLADVEKMCRSFPEKRQLKLDDLETNQMAELIETRQERENERWARLEEQSLRETLEEHLKEERRKNEEMAHELAHLRAQQSPGTRPPSAASV